MDRVTLYPGRGAFLPAVCGGQHEPGSQPAESGLALGSLAAEAPSRPGIAGCEEGSNDPSATPA